MGRTGARNYCPQLYIISLFEAEFSLYIIVWALEWRNLEKLCSTSLPSLLNTVHLGLIQSSTLFPWVSSITFAPPQPPVSKLVLWKCLCVVTTCIELWCLGKMHFVLFRPPSSLFPCFNFRPIAQQIALLLAAYFLQQQQHASSSSAQFQGSSADSLMNKIYVQIQLK